MRIRFYLFLLLICFLKTEIIAQPPQGEESSKYSFKYRNVVPGMPENAALGSYGNIPLNTAKGLPDINFNLFTISKGGVNVPISISYLASGIKYNDIASAVGMKWQLNAGGSVNRSVNGIVDEDYLLNNMASINPATIEYQNFHPNSHETQDACKLIAKNFTDCSLDYYYYNFPGHSGSMYLGSDQAFRADKEYRSLKINYTNHFDSFIIKDGDGNTFIFEAYTDQSTVYNTGKYNKQASSSFSARVSWKLRKIITSTKETINFEYTAYNYEYLTLDSERWTAYSIPNGIEYAPCGTGYYYVGQNEDSYQTTRFVNTAWLVSKIYTDDQEALFSYVTNTSAPIFQKQLSEINVKSKITGATVKKISFEHSGEYLTWFEEKGVTNIGKKTSFNYAGSFGNSFGIYSKNRDILGYYNGSSNNNLLDNAAAAAYNYPLPLANRRPNGSAAITGTLTDIIYPTGGRTTFEYEYNMYINGSDTFYSPGIRVKSVTDNDGNGTLYNKKIFHYGQLIGGQTYITLTSNSEQPNYLEPTMSGIFYSENQDTYGRDYFFYKSVFTETIGNTTGTTHHFEKDHYDSQSNLFDQGSPLLVRKDIYINDTFHLQQTVSYNYQLTPVDNVATKTYLMRKAIPHLGNYTYENDPLVYPYCPPATIYEGYDIAHNLKPMLYDLTNVTTRQYSSTGDSLITSTTNSYNSNGLLQQTETIGSDGNNDVVTYTYPPDYPGDLTLTRMRDSFLISPVVEEKYLVLTTLKKEKKNVYAFNGNGFFTISSQVITDAPTSTTQTLNYYGYTSKAKVVSMGRTDDVTTSYIWDYLSEMPIAAVINADNASIAYTSFEADGKGNWQFLGIPFSASSITGQKHYMLDGTPNTELNKVVPSTTSPYIVSYWTKNNSAFTITGTQNGYPIQGRTVNGWNYFEHKISGQSNVVISGFGTIDEVRLYPANARMTTYTYQPLIGVTSECDQNNRITYYQYDDLNRLILVRDQDRRIIKKICYNYIGQAENCTTPCEPDPDWQNTATAVRCQLNGSSQKTGYLEQEQKDLNLCSPTYNQTRWVVTEYNPLVCSQNICINCRGAANKCINGICEVGIKVYTASELISGTQYMCTYHYEWSDDSESIDFTEQHTGSCIVN